MEMHLAGTSAFPGSPRAEGRALAKSLGWVPFGLGLGLAAVAAAIVARMSKRDRGLRAAATFSGVAALGAIARRRRGGHPARTTQAITVNKPVDEVYRFWRDLENLPRFMRHLQAVDVIDERRSHWTAQGPGGAVLEWDAEIVEDVPNETIAWRSVGHPDVENRGAVFFEAAPGGRGTEVRVEMSHRPPGGALVERVAKLLRQSPEQKVKDDLRAFKQVMETGEVMRSDASVVPGRPHPAQPLARGVHA